jgi:hypothetical protein
MPSLNVNTEQLAAAGRLTTRTMYLAKPASVRVYRRPRLRTIGPLQPYGLRAPISPPHAKRPSPKAAFQSVFWVAAVFSGSALPDARSPAWTAVLRLIFLMNVNMVISLVALLVALIVTVEPWRPPKNRRTRSFRASSLLLLYNFRSASYRARAAHFECNPCSFIYNGCSLNWTSQTVLCRSLLNAGMAWTAWWCGASGHLDGRIRCRSGGD